MSMRATFEDTGSATSSPESVDGPMPYDWQVGQMMFPCGPEVVRVNRSARRENGEDSQTTGMCGLNGGGSSGNAGLSRSLASRLRAVAGLLGSTLFRQTWKMRVTPSGRVIYALRASARRTSGSGCGSLPTPTALSPGTEDYNEAGDSCNLRAIRLAFSPMPTPNAMAGGQTSRGGNRKGELLIRGLALSSVATPRAEDSESTGDHRGMPDTLTSQARLASLATPKTPTGGANPKIAGQTGADLQAQARSMDSGRTQSGSCAEAGRPGQQGEESRHSSPGQLNAAYSRWLMGYPVEWDKAAIRAYRQMKQTRPAKGGS